MLKKNLRILVLFLFIFVIGICLSVSANQLQKNNLSTEDVYINEEITTPVSRIATPKLNFKSKNICIRLIRRIFADIQTMFGLKRYMKEVKKGCQWCSITNEFVKYLLSNKTLINKYFNHTYCPDELVIQTLCWNSPFRNKVYNLDDEFKGCLRYINWDNGEIHLMDNEDPEKMVHSEFLFARKFSEDGLDNILKIKKIYSQKELL